MDVTPFHWIIFTFIIVLCLGFDLFRFYRNPHSIHMKEALLTSLAWIVLALIFNVWIFFDFGTEPALAFLTGYILEKSLSVDNLFIFLLIFSHFKVPDQSKHEVLFYGVIGAIVMRGLLIWGGITLAAHFQWIFVIFGLFLIITGIRLAIKRESESEIEQSRIYQWLKKHIPFTSYHGNKFFIQQQGQWFATPLLAVLILIEMTDLVFALDSVPAILGITTDPFIVFTSNIFAILGLRSLFFALEGIMKAFYLLHYALALILVFIGTKMMLMDYIHIPSWLTLSILLLTLAITMIASLFFFDNKFDQNQ